jgi:uncharacterized protein (TIGR03437 family)
VAKISSDGSTLAWATFFGGSAGDVGGSIAVDPQGNVYVAGRTTSPDFPVTSHAFGNVKAPATFFAKFDNSGTKLIFSGLASGLGNVFVGWDAAGSAYLAGVADGSGSTPLPATQGAILTGLTGLPSAYFCKLDPSGSTVLYGSYYGGNGPTIPSGLSVSTTGVVSIGGTTGAPDLPTSPGAFQEKLRGNTNAFALKFDTTARRLIFSTYLGGSSAGAAGVSSDLTGNVYLAGSAGSPDFPIVGGMQLPENSPGFATKLSPDGAHLIYSTRLAAVPLAMVGSADGTLTFFDSSYDGYFVHQLSPSGTSLTADFFLPGGSPYPSGMAVDGTHNVYLASWRSTVPGDVTNVPPFVGTPGSFQPSPAGEVDATVAKVSPTGGTLEVIPPSLDLQTTPGQQIQADLTIVSRGRPNALPVRYSLEVDVPWLTLPNFENRPVAYAGPPTYHITISVGSGLQSPLAPGTYSGRVIVQSPGTENSPVVVPVKLTVNAPNTSFPYAYPPFAHCKYRIGSDATDYNTNTLSPAIFIGPQVLSANVVSGGWLKFSTDSGVRCDPSNLAPGVYQGEVDVMAGTAAPGTLVKLYVDFTVSGTPVYANPGSVEFFALPGSAAAEAATVVTNQSAYLQPAALAFMNVTSTANWLTATPESGTLPDLLRIRADPKGLSPGVYRGAIRLKVDDVSIPDLSIPVILNITSGVPFTASPATVAYQLPSLEMLSRNRTIFLNSASPVHFNVTTSRGMLDLRVTPTSGTAPATLNLTAAGARFDLSSPSDFIAISTTEGGGFTQIIPVKISSAAFMATFTSSGVVNGATFAAGPVAPGSIVSIFGSYLSLIKEQAPSLPLTTDLAGSTVYVDGLPAPEFYVSPTQINIQVPPQVQPGSERIQIVLPGHPSDGASIDVASSAPGIFMYGGNHAAAQNADYSLNGPKNAARPGTALIIYMTGQGALDRQIPAGAASPANPLAHPLLPVTATIGSQPVDVLFAGMAPGLVGVCQVNLRVPNVPAGQYPVAITVGSVESNAPLVSIGPP